MLLAAVLIAVLVSVPLLGGRLSALADLSMRRVPVLAAGLAVQIVILEVISGAPAALLGAAHVASYALVAWWIAANRHVPGLLLMGSGGALNALAIIANDGVMPASPSALATAGMPATVVGRFTNSAAVEDPSLAFLGDVFAIPSRLPLASVYSVGDVLIALGAAYGLHVASRSRPGLAMARRLGRAKGDPAYGRA